MANKTRIGKGSKVDAQGRSTTERFIRLPHYMLRSSAWLTMSPRAKVVLLDVWQRHNGVNNGTISYSAREGKAVGFEKSATAAALAENVERGFLKVRRDSCFDLKTKEARLWEITAEPVGDRPASKDFMRWMPAADGVQISETRSTLADTQSAVADRDAADETMLLGSVRTRGPSTTAEAQARSAEPDTSIGHAGTVDQAVPQQPDQHPSTTASPSSPEGRDDCQGLAPSPVQPAATARPSEALQQAPAASPPADLYPEGQRTPKRRQLALAPTLLPNLPVDDLTPFQLAERLDQLIARRQPIATEVARLMTRCDTFGWRPSAIKGWARLPNKKRTTEADLLSHPALVEVVRDVIRAEDERAAS